MNGNSIKDTNTIILRNAIGDLKNAYAKGKKMQNTDEGVEVTF